MGLDWIGILFTMISTAMIIAYSYYVFFALIGFLKNKSSPQKPPKNSFAILIPAYREENVIGDTIKNLMSLDYPKNLYDVYVVTDTPDDMSGPAAAMQGGISIVRNNTKDGGKGFAVKWGLEEVRRRKDYDAYIIMDADNLLSANYLSRMNDELLAGSGIVQGHMRSKNPKHNWITKTIHVDYVTRNRFYKQPRQGRNLCTFMEPGICISREVLDRFGFDATSITEDIEYTSKLSSEGVAIRWVYDADVFEEKPTTLRVAVKQRQRWMLGHILVMRRYSGRLFSRFVLRGNTVAWDCLMYLILPAFMLVYFLSLLAYTLSGSRFSLLSIFPSGMIDPTLAAITTTLNFLIGFWWVAIPLYALYLEKERVREYWYTPFTMMFMFFIQLILFITSVFKRDKKTYWHTPHAVVGTEAHAEEENKPLPEYLDYTGK